MKRRLLAAALLLLASPRAHAAGPIAWQPWSEAAFATAKREHRFVIMDLEAVWCHWCHVMDETTYRDAKVVALLGSRYVAVRVDQDSRPDLANRYEDYGWPATIVFAADGSEIVRRRGYLGPAEMASMLQAIIIDPSPGPSVTADSRRERPAEALPEEAEVAAMRKRILSGYDRAVGGWSDEHRFLDADNVEYCLRAAGRGDAEAALVARDMLRLQRQLFDPVWGGVYQYSAAGDWVHPHFERIMSVEADNLRVYSLAEAQWSEWGYGSAARDVVRYLRGFLKDPDGAFYTSQDADLVPGEHSAGYFSQGDGGRRARGIPRVDMHRYSRENGWAISALLALHGATGDGSALAEGISAAGWVIGHRSLPGGGFRHDERDAAGPFLGDTLSMGGAFLALYQATGEVAWLGRAEQAADFVRSHFGRAGEPGFASSDTAISTFPQPQPQFDESVALARFANLLGRASGRPVDHALAESALTWARSPGNIAHRGAYVGGLLLAVEELNADPLHVTIVGRRGDPIARTLLAAALRAPTSYKLIEFWDRSVGPPPRGESIFPDLDRPAAYLCANGACSPPIPDGAALTLRLAKAASAAGGP